MDGLACKVNCLLLMFNAKKIKYMYNKLSVLLNYWSGYSLTCLTTCSGPVMAFVKVLCINNNIIIRTSVKSLKSFLRSFTLISGDGEDPFCNSICRHLQ